MKKFILVIIILMSIGFSMNLHIQAKIVKTIMDNVILLHTYSPDKVKVLSSNVKDWLLYSAHHVDCGIVFDYADNSIDTFAYSPYFKSVPSAMLTDIINFNDYALETLRTQMGAKKGMTYQDLTMTKNVYVGYYIIDAYTLYYVIFTKDVVIITDYTDIFNYWLSQAKEGGVQ